MPQDQILDHNIRTECCGEYKVHYINMIQGITGFDFNLLCHVEKNTTHEHAKDDIYGEEMYPGEDSETKAAISISGLHKTPSLQHSERTVFMLICENMQVEEYDMFGTLLNVLLYKKQVTSLEDILEMIDASDLREIQMMYMHIASIVAFHHYIRVEVHRVGNYKAKKTADLLESYKLVMIKGLLKTQLSKQACDYVEKWLRIDKA
jgi:hypothetical protein